MTNATGRAILGKIEEIRPRTNNRPKRARRRKAVIFLVKLSKLKKWNTDKYLDDWDGGYAVLSVTMGSGMLGPGYEQAIQVLMVEILRKLKNLALPEDEPSLNLKVDSLVDKVTAENEKLPGWRDFSGAQVGAAKCLAFQMWKSGCIIPDEIKESRKILISKHWIQAPERKKG